MTQGGTKKLPTTRRYKDRGSIQRRDMKNSSIPRSNKSRTKLTHAAPEYTTRNNSSDITQGISITQPEEMVLAADPEKDTQTDDGTNETPEEQFHEDSQRKNLDTSTPDRTVTKCSTDSGIADVEHSKIGPRDKSTINAGMRNDYFKGLDNLRKMISDIEDELNEEAREFYCCQENSEEKSEEYLKSVNNKLLTCNNILRKKQVTLEVIDSEIKIMSMLNNLREMRNDADNDVIDSMTDFYEHLNTYLNRIHMISIKYRNTVLKILRSSCTSYYNSNTNLEVSLIYRQEVKLFLRHIVQTLEHLDLLVKSYQNRIKQDLFSNTKFSERVLICCDQRAFPVLRLIPDVCDKINDVCHVSKQWIDKDQIYIQDIDNHIRQRRSQTRKKKQDLQEQGQVLDSKVKGVQDAYALFKENKKELKRIEKRLRVVEKRVEQCSMSKNYKEEERRHMEGMVGFLEISITQTKKNTTLQLKRNRLRRQLKELEESIRQIELELSQVQNDLINVQQERHTMEGKVEESNNKYVALKTDLDQFNNNFEALQREMAELSDGLAELEIIQLFKTSPEKVEDFYERPTTVKLAPSLQQRIKQKRKKRFGSKAK